MQRKLGDAVTIAAVYAGSLLFGLRSAYAAEQAVSAALKDGEYAGKRVNAFYGYLKVQAVVSGGKLTDVIVLEYPDDDRRSRELNDQVLPYLIKEAVAGQTYKVDSITGATFTSNAFMSSLKEALKAAGA
jgi:uncharacterized protein with FMN-binding domain